ncbi:MAG: YifB family Mg chelatase-like AAA ATPase [Candidatus Pacebacteria bacterium]|nr:YifB family Mg chelatase-like AAA ATPase [Candidatus Paceibacterota bacterium]
MPSKVFSAAVVGLDAQIIEVETDVSYGLPVFAIVGLPDKAVQEARERVSSAIKSSGFKSPHSTPVRVLVSLAPADLKKEGALYDLPIALAYLAASKQTKFGFEKRMFLGELALDGNLRPVKGALSFALSAKEKNFEEIILPKENAPEAALIKGIKVIPVGNLKETVFYLEGKLNIAPFETKTEDFLEKPEYQIDLSYVKGQEYAKRALEVSAAGSHNLLFTGPPGTGKSLLAKSAISILPSLSFEESLEVTKIYSVSGFLPKGKPLINLRPFRSPHHTSSEVALIGGGNPPRPGEITLAHRGVLFLDEFPEFHRDALESLRQPLEDGEVTVLRAKTSLTLPARFMLIAATNPCPCGYLNDPVKRCTCTPSQIYMYRRKLSGPLMDRMDLFIDVPPLKYEKLTSPDEENSSQKIKERVESARRAQMERFKNEKILTNSEMGIPQIKKYCKIDLKSEDLMRKYVDSGKISARGYHRVLKVARTIADLSSCENISFDHLAEALMYRVKEN